MKQIDIRRILENYARRRTLKKTLALLCVATIVSTMLSLRLEADTLERIATCGYAEHVHTEACVGPDGGVICGLEAHVHTDACYQQRPVEVELEAPVEELPAMSLDALEPEAAVEAAPVEEAQVAYAHSLAEPVLLSQIIEGLPVEIDAVVEVAAVVGAEDEASPVGVEVLEGDWLIYALRDFDAAELAVLTAEDVLVVTLIDGRAVAEVEAEVEAEEEKDELTAEIIAVDGGETAEDETEAVAVADDALAAEVIAEDEAETAEEENDELVADPIADGSEALYIEYDLAEADGGPLSLRGLLGDAILEDAEAATLLPIAYDEALLSAEAVEGDYLVTVVGDFDATEIAVGPHTVALLNGRAPEPFPAQTFAAQTEHVVVTVEAAVGAFPAGTTMAVADVDDAATISGITDAVEAGFVRVERVHAVDISFWHDGAEIEPSIPISVVMGVREIEAAKETMIVHVDDDGAARVVEDVVEADVPATEALPELDAEALEANSGLGFTADAFSVYAVVVGERLETKVLASDGATYRIEVTYGAGAGIPEGVRLEVAEVVEDAEYRAQVERTLPGNKLITLARFFDIKIMDGDAEVQPLEAVEVRVTLYDAAAEGAAEAVPVEAVEAAVDEVVFEIGEDAQEVAAEALAAADAAVPEADGADDHIVTVGAPEAQAAHFAAQERVELMGAAENADAVTFMADGFSVWGVVYTVDFYYGNYEWHIDGGSYMSLRALVEKLHIAEDAQAFVDQVADVVFSAPELVAVRKVEEDTTVGAIRAALGAEDTEYSAGLTEAQIEAINAAEIRAVDWALVSLRAFQSEERLSITLLDGTVYEVRVEDGQNTFHIRINDVNGGTLSSTHKTGNYTTLDYNSPYGDNPYYLHYTVRPAENGTYRKVFWLKEDGVEPDTVDKNNTNGVPRQNLLDSTTIEGETSFVFYFAPVDAKLVVIKPVEHGTVTGAITVDANELLPQYVYVKDTNITLTAIPEANYYFKGWLVDGKCISADTTLVVNKDIIKQDTIVEPIFSNSNAPWFELMMTEAENDPGYFFGHYAFGFHGKSYYYGPAYWFEGHYRIDPMYAAVLSNNTGYTFHYWLKDDGTDGEENDFTSHVDEKQYRGLRYNKNLFDTTTSFVAFFAPTDAKIIRFNPPAEGGSVSVKSGSNPPRSITTGTGKTFQYYYNTDGDTGGGATLVATPDTAAGYEFLGWFADGKWLVSRDREYIINSTKNTYDLNLVPLFELDAAHRDFYYVYFDGSNGVTGEAYLPTDIGHSDHTMYTRYDSNRKLYGANFAYIKVNKNQKINLPSQSGETTYTNVYSGAATQKIDLTKPQGTAYNNFDLFKWYKIPASPATDASASFGSEDNYLDLGASVTIDRDMVFYADWFPTSYDFSDGITTFEAYDQVIHKDTSDFIKTYLYDYSPIFNMPSLKLNSDSTINQAGNYEYWYLPDEAGNTSRNFVFITALSDEVRTVSPRNRKQSLRNQNRETTIDGTFYSGIISDNILKTDGLKDALFDTEDGLGKRYVGEAKNLYLYDDATGYFYYDSDKNAAKYNGEDSFVLAAKDNIDVIDKSNHLDGDFLPFNKVKDGDYIEGDGEPNYWFGMQSVITFALPNDAGYQDGAGNYGNQSTHGSDMVFKFCGDDDVWVYVDDELFLDMGGVHGKVYGEINFSTGKIAIASNGAEKKNDAIMTYEGDSTQVRENIDFPKTIKAGENHTLKVYYLERGSSQSNCAIYFNISPSYRVQLHKRDIDDDTELKGVTFEVYHDAEFKEPAKELWWKDQENEKKNSFDTGNNGLVTISGMLAGHIYYIREAKALEGYPNLKDEVIKLVFDSNGNATFECTPGFSGITPSLRRKEGSNYEFVMDLWNRKKTSITVKKDWLKADGSDGTPSDAATVGMTVKRYAMIGNPFDDLQTHTVKIVAKYYRGADGRAVYSEADIVGDPVAVKTYSYEVNDGDSIFFDVLAHHNGDALAIYSVDEGITKSNTELSRRLYGVGDTKKTLPVSEHYTKTNITEDLTINVCFIGDMGNGTEADFDAYALITEPLILTTHDGAAYYWGRKNDDAWSEAFTLPYDNTWSRTIPNLDAADTNGNPYYYYVSEDSITIKGVGKWDFYTDMYSPYAVGGDTITVTNRDETVQVKLRKYDPTKATENEQRDMPGAEFMIYTSYDVETRVCFQMQNRKDYARSIRIQARWTKERKREASLSKRMATLRNSLSLR
ncbi:MAG: hypothetical protein IJ646_08050, partial [Clostridia bacterium]|nr:hypothetical protein [Clostridia bacterium]